MQTIRLAAGTGEVTVTEQGGRVAGLHPAAQGPNLLWRGETAPVAGGDRLWLGPEREVIYDGDPTDRANWRCPPELDPGTWRARSDDDGVLLEQEALGARMRRHVRPLVQAPVATDLPWTGCEIRDDVEIDRDWSGWHLAMMPAPARLFVRRRGEPVPLYGVVPDPDGEWLHATGVEEWKVGFQPPDDGRVVMAALGDADPGSLVVLMTDADPDGTYRDLPPHGGGPTSALQLYNSPSLGFCELEHHFPLEAPTVTTVLLGCTGSRADRLAWLRALAA